MIWYDIVWCGMIWYDMVWYDRVWCGVVWYGMIWCGMEWLVWCGMVWYGLVWCGVVWYDMMWYGMVWKGMMFHPSSEILFMCDLWILSWRVPPLAELPKFFSQGGEENRAAGRLQRGGEGACQGGGGIGISIFWEDYWQSLRWSVPVELYWPQRWKHKKGKDKGMNEEPGGIQRLEKLNVFWVHAHSTHTRICLLLNT